MHGGGGGDFQESISKNGYAHIGKRIFLGGPIDRRLLAANGFCRFVRFAGLGRWRLGGWFAGIRIFLAERTSTFGLGRRLFFLRSATTLLLGTATFTRPEIATPARRQQQHEAGRQCQGSGQENVHAAIIRRGASTVKGSLLGTVSQFVRGSLGRIILDRLPKGKTIELCTLMPRNQTGFQIIALSVARMAS